MSIEKWREAHPDITFPDEGLATMAPFPSLAASDYVHYLDSRGDIPADVIAFIKDAHRELIWVYGNWAKEQMQRDGVKLMDDLVRNIPKEGAPTDFMFRWIRDYRAAHNLNWADPKEQNSWEQAMLQPLETIAANSNGGISVAP